MTWDTSCLDWPDRIREGRSLLPDLPLVSSEAEKALAIFKMLRLPDVPGEPAFKDAAGDWMFDLVRALFGGFDPKENVRHLREAFVLCPKKSAKTTLGAAVMLVAVLMSRRPRAEFLLVAPTQEVSDLAFRQAVGMIEADPVLAAKFHIQEHIKKVTYRSSGAFLKVKSFDPKIVTGSKPAGVLLDEMHVIAEAHDADRVVGQLRGGLISQPEAFMVTITTQSERPPVGVFKAELQKARSVRDGRLKAPLLPLLYEFPLGVEWRDPSNWWMVTPNRGRSITVDRLIPDYEAADAAGPAELARWASQHLNVEIGLALRSDRWTGADLWQQAARPLTLDDIIERSDVLTLGIDGGGLDDLLGACVIGRNADNGQWMAWGRAWAHPIVLERRKSEASKLRDMDKAGDLMIVQQVGDDMADLADLVKRLEASGKLAAIGVDPAGISDIVTMLRDDCGIEEDAEGKDRIIGVSQGWKLTGIIKTCERKLAERDAGKQLTHCGQALMAWCVGNAKVEPRGNAVLITKAASGTGKIDPLMAMFNAATIMADVPELNICDDLEVMVA